MIFAYISMVVLLFYALVGLFIFLGFYVTPHFVLIFSFASAINSSKISSGTSELKVSTKNCPQASQNTTLAIRAVLPEEVRCNSSPV